MSWSKHWSLERRDDWRWWEVDLERSGLAEPLCPWGMDFGLDVGNPTSDIDPGFWLNRAIHDLAEDGFPLDASPTVHYQADDSCRLALETSAFSCLPSWYGHVTAEAILGIDIDAVIEDRGPVARAAVEAWLAKLAAVGRPSDVRLVFWWNPP